MCLVSLSIFSQETDLFSEKHIGEYARFLFNTNQYSYAAEEYERLVFMDRTNVDYQVNLLRSYRLAGEYEKGLNAFGHLQTSSHEPGSALMKEYSKISLLSGNAENLRTMLREWPMDKSFRDNLDLTMRLISYPQYSLTLEGLEEDMLEKGLLDLYSEAFNLKHKSRFLAGSLSAVVPGLGKVYSGRWKDAIVSVIFIAGTGYQAYRAFKEQGISSVYGWIMGSLSFGFYIGNIYGSARSARIYNMNQDLKYREKVIDHYINHY